MVLLGRRLAPAPGGEDLTLTGICLRSWPSRNGFHLPCSFNSSLCARALLANLAIDLDICGPVFILLTLSLNLRLFLSALHRSLSYLLSPLNSDSSLLTLIFPCAIMLSTPCMFLQRSLKCLPLSMLSLVYRPLPVLAICVYTDRMGCTCSTNSTKPCLSWSIFK